MTGTDSGRPPRELKAAPDWGDDVSPEAERWLEFIYSRIYHAWRSGGLEATDDRIDDLGHVRMHLEDYLDPGEQEDLADLERAIRRVERGDGPAGVDSTEELDRAWVYLLLEGVDRYREGCEP